MRKLVFLLAGVLVPAILTAQLTQQWVAEYDREIPVAGDDNGQAVAVDANGYVYVAGYGQGIANSLDYVTIKYDPSTGETLWVRYYDGPGYGSDYAYAIAVDGSGNAYVTGYDYGSRTGNDYATVKYDANGNQQWVARYNGPGNGSDVARAIAVDGSGNAYVTGRSPGSGTDYDYATVKYDANGNQQWVARYNGPGNGYDVGYAIAVDGSGNTHVTGYSTGSGYDYDYATVKYDANGNQQWVARYNGPGNYYDNAYAIAVDGSGNAYVTGRSGGSGTDYDYATVKYDANGNQQWVARYNGPGNGSDDARAIAVDGSGNAYVTGYGYGSGTNSDYATVKYDANGSQQWVARYNGQDNGNDYAYAIAVDGSGIAHVTGYSDGSGTGSDYATVKYDASGNQQWVARYNGPVNGNDDAKAIAVDGSGNAYVIGSSSGSGTGYDYATVKYSGGGSEVWVARYTLVIHGSEAGRKVAIDGSGNVLVTGSTYSPGTIPYDCVTIKYDPSTGETLWVRIYNGPNNSNDGGVAIAVDGSGNAYVTGYSYGSGDKADFATVKYDANGNRQWVARYNGPGNGSDIAYAIAVDGSGNAYVTGNSYGSGTNTDYATVKYDANGNQLWVARYNGPGGGNDYGRAIAVDRSGNAYVIGNSSGSGTGYDYATVKYDANGNQQWVARYNGPANGMDNGYDLALDGSGNAYVTGYSYSSSSNLDYATVKYDANGNQQWVARYNGPGFENTTAIAVDGSGSAYVTGTSAGSGTGADYVTVKYDANGNQQWVARYNGPGNRDDLAYAIALDNTGSVYVTGHSVGSGTGDDYATLMYDGANGSQIDCKRYTVPGAKQDQAYSIATGPDGAVAVTGCSSMPAPEYGNIVTIKYQGPQAPESPVLVSPENEATSQELWGALSWNAAVRADCYDVYVGTDPGNLTRVSEGQTSLIYAYTGFPCNVLHYWKVVARNGSLATPSEVWSFTTGTVDAGVSGIIEPSGLIDTLQETPEATVRSFGTLTRDVTVWFEVKDPTGTVRYLQSVNVTALPGETEITVSNFPEWDVPNDLEGRYTARAWTVLSGDNNPTNDQATLTFGVEAAPQAPAQWVQWPSVPQGPQRRVVQHGSCAATDPEGRYLYLLKGDNTCEFYRYDPATLAWTTLEPIPEYGRDHISRTVKEGGTLAQVGGRFYATKGGNSTEFWEYNPGAGSGSQWTQLADAPGGTHSGASASGVGIVSGRYVYLLRGAATFDFSRYSVADNAWEVMADAPGPDTEAFKLGSSITYNGMGTIYALKGIYNRFYSYSVATNTWSPQADLPLGPKNKQAKGGAAICHHLGKVYCIKGSNSQEFWIYDCNTGAWAQDGDVPLGKDKTRVQDGGTLVYCSQSRYLYATKGGTLELWSYGRLTNYDGPMGVASEFMPVQFSLVVSPSATSSRAQVRYAIPKAGNVELAVYDATGRLTRTLVQGMRGPGVHTASLAASELARGVYIVRYRSGDFEASRKLIIE